MASETVKKILQAEAESDRLTTEARKKADDIINEAQRQSTIAMQKKLAEAKSETDKIRQNNAQILKEYEKKAQKNCAEELDKLKITAEKNSAKAVSAVIDRFFN